MPIRTCVGCRRTGEINADVSLLRLVLLAGRVRLHRDSVGRGAWVHRRLACVQSAVRQALPKLFGAKAVPSVETLWNEIVA